MTESSYQHILSRSYPRSGSAENDLLLNKKILFERVDMLYRLALAGFIATLANMVIAVIGLWNDDNNQTLIFWAVSVLAITGARFALVKVYQSSRAVPDQAQRWEYLFCSGALAMGLIWAALAWLFFPQADELHRLLIIFIIGGMAAGSTGSLAPSLLAHLGFNLPPALILAFLMFSSGGKIYFTMGLLILVFIGIQIRYASLYRRGIDQITISYFNNEALHEKVRQSEKRLADAIESFPEGFALFDTDDRLILCNSKYIEAHGEHAGVESLIGKKFSHLARWAVEKGEVSETATGIRSYYLGGTSLGHGSIHLTRQGDIITIHSDTKRTSTAEASLKTVRLEQNVLFAISQEGIALVRNEIVVGYNPRLEQLLGYGSGKLAAQSLGASQLSDEFSRGISSSIYAQLHDGQAHQGELELLRKDGSRLPCRYVGKATDPIDMLQTTVWVFTAIDGGSNL